MALPAIPDELLVDIFLRLPTPEDLIRASAACVSFRRLVADRSFLRRFRKLHPPPLLGFVDYRGFHPAVPPHPSAPAASAVASAADFDFTFLPAPYWDWTVREVRDGRVLLDRPCRHDELGSLMIFKEMVVCDPLHRQYLLLPPIPDDLAASAVSHLLIERNKRFAECFLVPSGDDEEAAAADETSFRVIWLLVLQTKPVAAVFSSGTGQWQALSRSESLPGFLLSTWKVWFVSRHYAHGCFYWVSGSSEKLLVLDIRTMEFSMVDHPLCARFSGDDVAIVEAGQGITLMFVPKPDTSRLIYMVWRNNGGSSIQWQMEKTISLDSDSLIRGAVGRHLLVYHIGRSSVKQGCYMRDVDTSQLERVCGSCRHPLEAYCNFPPSLLSLPTVSSGTRHADAQGAGEPEPRESDPVGVLGPVIAAAAQAPRQFSSVVVEGARRGDIQGAGDDVMVPELQEADTEGVQGPVVAAAARALNPLLVVEGTHHPDVLGTGDAMLVPQPREAGPGGVTLCNAGTLHTDGVQGAGHDVPVSGLREADPVGVQGPVHAAVARAPNSCSSTSAMPGRVVVGRGVVAAAGAGPVEGAGVERGSQSSTSSVRKYLSHKWIEIDVSRTKICLDTSIFPTSISGRRE